MQTLRTRGAASHPGERSRRVTSRATGQTGQSWVSVAREGRRRSHPSHRRQETRPALGRASSCRRMRPRGETTVTASPTFRPCHQPTNLSAIHPGPVQPPRSGAALIAAPRTGYTDTDIMDMVVGGCAPPSAEWRMRAATLDRAGTLDVARARATSRASTHPCTDGHHTEQTVTPPPWRRGQTTDPRRSSPAMERRSAMQGGTRRAGHGRLHVCRLATAPMLGKVSDATTVTATPRRPNAFTTTPPCA